MCLCTLENWKHAWKAIVLDVYQMTHFAFSIISTENCRTASNFIITTYAYHSLPTDICRAPTHEIVNSFLGYQYNDHSTPFVLPVCPLPVAVQPYSIYNLHCPLFLCTTANHLHHAEFTLLLLFEMLSYEYAKFVRVSVCVHCNFLVIFMAFNSSSVRRLSTLCAIVQCAGLCCMRRVHKMGEKGQSLQTLWKMIVYVEEKNSISSPEIAWHLLRKVDLFAKFHFSYDIGCTCTCTCMLSPSHTHTYSKSRSEWHRPVWCRMYTMCR